MVGQTFVQPVANQPPDRDGNPRFPHQSAVVRDPEQ